MSLYSDIWEIYRLIAECQRKGAGGGLRGHIFLPVSTHTHTHIKEDLWKVEGDRR